MRTLQIWLGLAAFTFHGLAADFLSPAAERHPLKNFDARQPSPSFKGLTTRAPVATFPAHAQREIDVQVDFDEATGSAKFVRDLGGLLSSDMELTDDVAAGREVPMDPFLIVGRYLKEHSEAFGHGAEVLRSARILRDYTSPVSGLRTVTWQQYLVGIPVFEAVLTASLTDAGGLIALSTQFIPDTVRAAATGPARRRTIDATPRITARQAAAAACESIGESFTSEAFLSRRLSPRGWVESQELIRAGSSQPFNADLVWFPTGTDKLRLCWRLIVQNRSGNVFQVLVDAGTGKLQVRHSWSHGFAPGVFRVFPSDSPSPFSPGHPQNSATNQPMDLSTPAPEFTNQLDVTFTTNAASPAGWINDSAAFNFQNTTVGNNVDAHLDLFDENPAYDGAVAAPPEARPPGALTNGAVHFHFTADLGQPPFGATNAPATTNQKAAVVNAFYWGNWMHDRLWTLGFNEAAGNFQHDNFGRGGVGGDPVLVDVQNKAALGNRNSGYFSASPADGTPVRISLALWNGPSPERDGAFDVEVFLHEYVHLLTTRRVGHGVGLSSDQALGLAEGWSDFVSLCLLSEPGDDFGGAFAYGAFSTYRWSALNPTPLTQNYHYGMRRYPYSTNMARNPLTFNDLDAFDATGHLAVAVSPAFQPYDPFAYSFEPHCIGEIWGVTLWEFFANMVQKHGFAAGREMVLRTVLEGMSLCPPNPTLIQARDALVLSDRVLTGGSNWTELWRAFAKRGMGWSAPEPIVVGVPRVTAAFDLPPTGQILSGWPFLAKNGVRSSPAASSNAIYVGSSDGRFYSLSPGGTTNWSFFPQGTAPFVSSASIHPDGTIHVKRNNGWLYALRPDGTVRWSNRIDAASTASPAVAADGSIYVVGNRDLIAFQPNGTLKWKFIASKTINSSPSVGVDGTIYFGSGDGRLYAVDPLAGALRPGWPFNAGQPILSSPAISSNGLVYFGCLNRRVYALNGATGAKLWEFAAAGSIQSSPALDSNGAVYIGSDDRRVYALRASDGQLKWSFRTGGAVRSSPAVSADRIVYVGASDGFLYALAATSGQMIYRFRIGGNIYSSPLISSEGNVYVGSSNGKIIGLRGSQGPAGIDWPMFRRDPKHLANVGLP